MRGRGRGGKILRCSGARSEVSMPRKATLQAGRSGNLRYTGGKSWARAIGHGALTRVQERREARGEVEGGEKDGRWG